MQETITFKSSGWTRLVWILNNPGDLIQDIPLMILCHWFYSHKWRATYLDLEKNMADMWVATFRFDFFGNWESWGELWDITLTEGIDNTIQAYELMISRGFKNIGLFGSSFGWCVVLNTADKLWDKILCLVCKCPVSDYITQKRRKLWEEWIELWKQKWFTPYENWGETYQLKYTYYEDMKHNNVYDIASNIKIPTLIVHWTEDEDVLVSQSIETAELIPNCKLELVEWAWHSFNNPGERELINWFFKDFVYRHLKSK